MRVVHMIKIKAVAGAERHLLLLAEGQRRRGLEVSIVVLINPQRPMDDFMAAAAARGIPAQRLPIYRHTDLTLYPRLRRVLRAQRPDVVHTHLIHADLFGIPAARLAGVPVVISSRHNDDPRRRQLWLRLLSAGLWRLSDGGIAISEAVRRFILAVEAVSPAKIRTIRYGLTAQPPLPQPQTRRAVRSELGLPDDAEVAGLVCRLTPEKGIPYALAAFDQLAPRRPNLHLLIVGDGDARDAVHAAVRQLQAADRVHLLGWREDTPRLLAALDVMLLPSLREGFGLVILEANAQQVPVIASAVSAIPEVIADGETGLLVPPQDSGALAQALEHLLDDPPLRQHMGLMARDRLETDFSADRMTDETIAFYAELLARKPRA